MPGAQTVSRITRVKTIQPSVILDPPLESWPDAGVYQLWMHLPTRVRLKIGRLGTIAFPSGTYVYTGRASRNLRARILRHIHGAQRRYWHIDYFLANRHTVVQRVMLASRNPNEECAVNQAAGKVADNVAPGFGSSDCTNGCGTHLWYVLHKVR